VQIKGLYMTDLVSFVYSALYRGVALSIILRSGWGKAFRFRAEIIFFGTIVLVMQLEIQLISQAVAVDSISEKSSLLGNCSFTPGTSRSAFSSLLF
jgi:hypothetical protein